METIGESALYSFIDQSGDLKRAKCTQVRNFEGLFVGSYVELARRVAELQFRNPEHLFLFRGQKKDYPNAQKNTMLRPSILHGKEEKAPSADVVQRRYHKLRHAEMRLAEIFNSRGWDFKGYVKRRKIVRWSILQHYGVCGTPLLDVTHSLRIAASFAEANENQEFGYVFVLGVPNLSGAVTASAEASLQAIRLSSICPPQAYRPHLQEGYLLGEYPDLDSAEQKLQFKHYEIDFGRRLVGKFRFNPKDFWRADSSFPMVNDAALYPNNHDEVFAALSELKAEINQELPE